ncbi:MAG TPA: peptidase MA family metallohydrolase [Candidatus Limnocylindria bacterium]|nr:peptidase MA family metallohydrolase [Candidatus Limnocylindria bacterium]
MGRLRALTAAVLAALTLVAAGLGPLGVAVPTRAGSGFSALEADATFGEEMTFSATWGGDEPDYVELLLGFGGEDRLVVPVELESGRVEHLRDMTDDYVPPNTTVEYRWRAVSGAQVTLSPEQELLYDDDRPQFDWDQARIGSATVHWYGQNEAIARRFGDLAGDAADAASDLLGRPLADPIEIFVYDGREDFLGAVGPGTREWVGAATYPHLRTVYMWLGAGSSGFLETTIAHEVTHVVFHDASDNPFHDPASWLNEGTATWAELGNADTEADVVRSEAGSADGLMAFEALTNQFPIDTRGATLAYAQGATMVDHLLGEYGSDALAEIMDAYRSGATDDEAIAAGTGTPFDEIRADYFASFGVSEPQPVEAQPLGRSDVPLPPQPGGVPAASDGPEPQPGPGAGSQDVAWWIIIGLVIVGGAFFGVALWRARRAAPPSGGTAS